MILLNSLIMVVGVFVASIGQVLLKKSAQISYDRKIFEYVNWRVLTGYGMMFLATLCSVYAYRIVPISLGMVLDSTGYIFMTMFSVYFFKEHVNWRRRIALGLIIIGIFVYSFIG